MAWIAQQFDGTVYFHRAAGIASASDERSIAAVAKMVPAQVEYATESPNADTAVANLAIEYGLKLEHSKPVSGDFWALVDDALRLGANKALYVDINVRKDWGEWSSHAVAFHVDADKRVHFFDPNVGEYALRATTSREFFIAYTDIYARLGRRFVQTHSSEVRVDPTGVIAMSHKYEL